MDEVVFPFPEIFILYLTKYDIFSKVDLRAKNNGAYNAPRYNMYMLAKN